MIRTFVVGLALGISVQLCEGAGIVDYRKAKATAVADYDVGEEHTSAWVENGDDLDGDRVTSYRIRPHVVHHVRADITLWNITRIGIAYAGGPKQSTNESMFLAWFPVKSNVSISREWGVLRGRVATKAGGTIHHGPGESVLAFDAHYSIDTLSYTGRANTGGEPIGRGSVSLIRTTYGLPFIDFNGTIRYNSRADLMIGFGFSNEGYERPVTDALNISFRTTVAAGPERAHMTGEVFLIAGDKDGRCRFKFGVSGMWTWMFRSYGLTQSMSLRPYAGLTSAW